MIKVSTFHEPRRTPRRNHGKNTSFTPTGIQLAPGLCGIPRVGKINARRRSSSFYRLHPSLPFVQSVPVEIRFTPVACLHRRKLIPTNYGPNFTASVFCDTRTRVHLREVANERAFLAHPTTKATAAKATILRAERQRVIWQIRGREDR